MKGRFLHTILFLAFASLILIQCKEEKPAPVVEKKAPVTIPAFNQDSAFAFLEKQLEFGPRFDNEGFAIFV